MIMDAARQVEGLRAAAAQLGGPVNTLDEVTVPTWAPSPAEAGGAARTRRLMTLPGGIARPLAGELLVAADAIEQQGRSWNLPVSYALEIAGAVLGQDLGHNP